MEDAVAPSHKADTSGGVTQRWHDHRGRLNETNVLHVLKVRILPPSRVSRRNEALSISDCDNRGTVDAAALIAE